MKNGSQLNFPFVTIVTTPALKKAGFTSVVEWHGGKWEDIPIG